MGPLAEQTLAGVRSRGAAKRKKARRVEAFIAEGSMKTSDIAREDRGETRGGGRTTTTTSEGSIVGEHGRAHGSSSGSYFPGGARSGGGEDEPTADANGTQV